ncbi:hypothetical protein ACA910_006147 [Epithemia clementina (nom. ined.)]
MGDVWIPDRATTLEVIKGSIDLLKQGYSTAVAGQRQLEICLTALLFLVGYAAALSTLMGEEIPQIDLGMMQKYWAKGKEYTHKPHVPLTLVGRFKQTRGVTKTYIQPLALVTSAVIQVQLWLWCTIDKYNLMGIKTGPMFRAIQGRTRIVHATIGHLDS